MRMLKERGVMTGAEGTVHVHVYRPANQLSVCVLLLVPLDFMCIICIHTHVH